MLDILKIIIIFKSINLFLINEDFKNYIYLNRKLKIIEIKKMMKNNMNMAFGNNRNMNIMNNMGNNNMMNNNMNNMINNNMMMNNMNNMRNNNMMMVNNNMNNMRNNNMMMNNNMNNMRNNNMMMNNNMNNMRNNNMNKMGNNMMMKNNNQMMNKINNNKMMNKMNVNNINNNINNNVNNNDDDQIDEDQVKLEISPDDIYNKKEAENMKDLLTCPICLSILISPVQCNKCNKCFCKICINNCKNSKTVCPFRCENPTYSDNKFVKNVLAILKFKCKNGCKEIINYEDLEKHFGEDCDKIDFKAKYKELLEKYKILKKQNRENQIQINNLMNQNNKRNNNMINNNMVNNNMGNNNIVNNNVVNNNMGNNNMGNNNMDNNMGGRRELPVMTTDMRTNN